MVEKAYLLINSWVPPCPQAKGGHIHLRETALVIEDLQNAMRPLGNQLNAGLVVRESNLSPFNLLTDIFFLRTTQEPSSPLSLSRAADAPLGEKNSCCHFAKQPSQKRRPRTTSIRMQVQLIQSGSPSKAESMEGVSWSSKNFGDGPGMGCKYFYYYKHLGRWAWPPAPATTGSAEPRASHHWDGRVFKVFNYLLTISGEDLF